jgi:hypothetical protein
VPNFDLMAPTDYIRAGQETTDYSLLIESDMSALQLDNELGS